MCPGNKSISVSTLVSVALHLLLAAAVLQSHVQVQGTGPGIAIELVSSTYISDSQEAEQAAPVADAVTGGAKQDQPSVSSVSEVVKATPQFQERDAKPQPPGETASGAQSMIQDGGEQVSARSTAASANERSILELLHSKISEHKQYPYLARRQRREGIATVEFVLQPDGAILNPRLVQSSRTRVLDKAALDAVKGIAPFEPARGYLDQAEAFRVDVVFSML